MSRTRRKRDDIIEIDHQEVGCGRMDYIGVRQYKDMSSLEGKSQLSRPRRKRDDINKIELKEVCCGRMTASACVRIGNWGNLEERDH